MNEVNNNSVLNDLSIRSSQQVEKKDNELGQSAFS